MRLSNMYHILYDADIKKDFQIKRKYHTYGRRKQCVWKMMTSKINEEKINFFSKRIKSGHIKVGYPTTRRYNYKQTPLSRRENDWL